MVASKLKTVTVLFMMGMVTLMSVMLVLGQTEDKDGVKKSAAKAEKEKKDPPKYFTNSIGMKFVWIPPGNFMMGSRRKKRKGKTTKPSTKSP